MSGLASFKAKLSLRLSKASAVKLLPASGLPKRAKDRVYTSCGVIPGSNGDFKAELASSDATKEDSRGKNDEGDSREAVSLYIVNDQVERLMCRSL